MGFKNEDDGYELLGPQGKSCVKPKAITLIRGTMTKPSGVHVFEGVMDFLSVMEQRKGTGLMNDAIVLNSVSLCRQAKSFMKKYGYGYAYTWLDNDAAGRKAHDDLALFFQSERMTHRPQNNRYESYKDVNDHHMAQIKRTIHELKGE